MKTTLATFAACLALAGFPAAATTIIPLYLDEIVATAEVAFEGTVTGNRVERDAGTGLAVTYTTFAVKDVIKGTPAATHVIKQVGGEAADGGPSYQIRGVPRFIPGEDYVVFLPRASSLGFSTPVGLHQGRFKVERENGRARVSNGRDFKDLTANIPEDGLPPAAARVRGAPGRVHDMDLADFKQLARSRGDKGAK